MRWSEFAARQSLLAAVAEDQLITPGVLLIGTTEYLRPALTPTSLGSPEPVRRLLPHDGSG